jgi:HD superfamily phosphohydrolase YqeK
MCSKYYDTKTLQHCLRVAKNAIENVCLRSDDDKQIAFIIALCHDLLEDTNICINTIAEVTELSMDF